MTAHSYRAHHASDHDPGKVVTTVFVDGRPAGAPIIRHWREAWADLLSLMTEISRAEAKEKRHETE